MFHESIQYIFNFEANPEATNKRQKAVHVLRRLQPSYATSLAYEALLRDQGIPIISVRTENDDESVEADYGAPLIGFADFTSFLNPPKSFRYEPVRYVDEVAQTHFPEKMAVAKRLKEQGYSVLQNWFDPESVASQVHFTNGGVTKAFSDVMGHICERFRTIKPLANMNGRDQGGAIVVPVPTYGLFLARLEQMVDGHDLRIVYVRRRENGSVDRNSLSTQLKLCEEEGLRVIAYYDCNPNNPTGYIRGKEDTLKTAKILEDFTYRQIERDQRFLSDLREKNTDANVMSRLSLYYLDTIIGRPMILDDMAYEGLEIETRKKPFSFGQASDLISEQTIVFKGLSKIGLPGMRIGMAIGDTAILSQISQTQFLSDFAANSFGVDILSARYGGHPKESLFTKHQSRLRSAHKERFLFTKAFFKGVDNVPELTPTKRKKLIQQYADYKGCTFEESEYGLSQGLPNFHVPDRLESGFFLPVSFESLHGRKVAIKYNGNRWPYLNTIDNSTTLHWLLCGYQIKTVAAIQQGASDKSLSARMTLSMSENDFYRFFDQMRKMHVFFFGENPEVQKDLFRDYAGRERNIEERKMAP